MPANTDLVKSFQSLIADFNNVGTSAPPTYDTWGGLYLYPSPDLIIQKVDDPGQFVIGSPNVVIDYLNTTQATTQPGSVKPFFPQFVAPNPTPYEHGSKHSVMIGEVFGGDGRYYDTSDDLTTPPHWYYPVHYCFRFKRDASTKNWLLCSAFLVQKDAKTHD
jgi:hypothetical protein